MRARRRPLRRRGRNGGRPTVVARKHEPRTGGHDAEEEPGSDGPAAAYLPAAALGAAQLTAGVVGAWVVSHGVEDTLRAARVRRREKL